AAARGARGSASSRRKVDAGGPGRGADVIDYHSADDGGLSNRGREAACPRRQRAGDVEVYQAAIVAGDGASGEVALRIRGSKKNVRTPILNFRQRSAPAVVLVRECGHFKGCSVHVKGGSGAKANLP